MGKDHGGQLLHPNKKGLGIKPVMPAENLESNDGVREKDIRHEDELAEKVREKRPHRNRNKEDSTNAGASQ